MDKDEKITITKNNSDIIIWFSIIFIGVMLFLAFLILQTMFEKKDYGLNKNLGINKQISIESKWLPGFIPNQNDDSMKVSFYTPDGMFEDNEQARKSGVYKVYRSSDIKLVSPESVISISFTKKKNSNLGLKDFIFANTRNIKQIFPNQNMTIGIVHLQMDVVEKFENMGIPYQTILYNIDKGVYRSGLSCAIFFFETPDGFWSINWTAPMSILENEKGKERGIFLGMIKYMTMMIFNPNTKSAVIVM